VSSTQRQSFIAQMTQCFSSNLGFQLRASLPWLFKATKLRSRKWESTEAHHLTPLAVWLQSLACSRLLDVLNASVLSESTSGIQTPIWVPTWEFVSPRCTCSWIERPVLERRSPWRFPAFQASRRWSWSADLFCYVIDCGCSDSGFNSQAGKQTANELNQNSLN
jgi:hypothetical protein